MCEKRRKNAIQNDAVIIKIALESRCTSNEMIMRSYVTAVSLNSYWSLKWLHSNKSTNIFVFPLLSHIIYLKFG